MSLWFIATLGYKQRSKDWDMAMRDDRTESLEPYEPPDSGYDWDFNEEPDGRTMPNILWGRVAVLGAALILAFLLGRLTAGGGDVSQEDFDQVRAERDDARAQVEELQAALNEAQQATPTPNATPTTDGTGEGGEGEEQPAGEVETYTIQSGDTLRTIAEDQYGDASLADALADFNDIIDPSAINTGDEIEIPPEEELEDTVP
jgi:nucleoid-associated protein YgaU